MPNEIVLGTVRGKNSDGSLLLVSKNGKRMSVHFSGDKPSLGSDVIGNIAEKDGKLTMSVKPTLLEAIVDGNAKIIPISQRTDITARILSRLFSNSKSAVFKSGTGMAIERSPNTDDKYIKWAMDIFKPEAERLGLALNVIDVRAVSRSQWDIKSLQNFSLPADIEGSRRSRNELTKILRSGFNPACSRIVEHFTGSNDISVNFLLPYSPFSGALGFARDIAKMDIGIFPTTSISLEDSRRLSCARQMAMALAHNRLSAGKGLQTDIDSHPRVRHLSNSFADAAAILTYLTNGGSIKVANEFSALRKSSLFFGYDQGKEMLKDGVLENATHHSIDTAIEWFEANQDKAEKYTIKEIVSRAVRIAKSCSYEGIRFNDCGEVFSQEMDMAVEAANSIACDINTASGDLIQTIDTIYRNDLDQLISEHGDNPLSAQRLLTFGSLHTPIRLERTFTNAMRGVSDFINKFDEERTADKPQEAKSSKSTFVARIKKAASSKPMDIEFADTPVELSSSYSSKSL